MEIRSRVAIRAIVGASLSWLLLFGVVQAALSVPRYELLSGIDGSSALDYSALPHSLVPLSPEYIARILGLDLPQASEDIASVSADGSAGPLAAPFPGVTTIDNTGGDRTVVEHDPTNDDFADAYPITSIPFTAKTDASRATREPGEPLACDPASSQGPTLWYRFRPARPVGLVASMQYRAKSDEEEPSESVDDPEVSVGVFTGSDLRTLERIGCDKDLAGNAAFAFPADEGVTYYVQLTLPSVTFVRVGPEGGQGWQRHVVFSLDPLGATERASVSSDNEESNGWSMAPQVSGNGRFVTFMSHATNLVPNDDNVRSDVFVRDLFTGRTEMVSVNSAEQPGNDHSGDLRSAISTDGRFVAFYSSASNLVRGSGGAWDGDTNGVTDVFVRDRLIGKTTRVSVSSSGSEVSGDSSLAPMQDTPPSTYARGISISGDGRFVAFESWAGGLVRRCFPAPQIYVHDRRTGKTECVSVNSEGNPANDHEPSGLLAFTDFPVISTDGRYVAFRSSATNLVGGDTNEAYDIFVRDRLTDRTERVTVNSRGTQQNDHSYLPAISADGRYVAFYSLATNLTDDYDGTGDVDVFVHDRTTNKTVIVSVNSSGEKQEPTGTPDIANDVVSPWPDISADGRYVVFSSSAANLAPGDQNGTGDIFLHDRLTGITTLVSVSTAGDLGDGQSLAPALAPNASSVAFASQAGNFDNDGNRFQDVFVHSLPFL